MQEDDPEVLNTLKELGLAGSTNSVEILELPRLFMAGLLGSETGKNLLMWGSFTVEDRQLFISCAVARMTRHVNCNTTEPEKYKAIPSMLLEIASGLEKALNEGKKTNCSEKNKGLKLPDLPSPISSPHSVNWDKELEGLLTGSSKGFSKRDEA